MKKKVFSQVTFAGYVKNALKLVMKKLEKRCHITGQFRDAVQQSRNKNLQLTKKVHAIFHNLRGYGSHLSFYELKKFDVTIDAIPNKLEKYMVFMISKYLLTVCNI